MNDATPDEVHPDGVDELKFSPHRHRYFPLTVGWRYQLIPTRTVWYVL